MTHHALEHPHPTPTAHHSTTTPALRRCRRRNGYLAQIPEGARAAQARDGGAHRGGPLPQPVETPGAPQPHQIDEEAPPPEGPLPRSPTSRAGDMRSLPPAQKHDKQAGSRPTQGEPRGASTPIGGDCIGVTCWREESRHCPECRYGGTPIGLFGRAFLQTMPTILRCCAADTFGGFVTARLETAAHLTIQNSSENVACNSV